MAWHRGLRRVVHHGKDGGLMDTEDLSIQGNTPKDESTPCKPGRIRVWVKALPSGGFNRAGMRWVSEEWTMADCNPAQLASLESEPLVAVRRDGPDDASALVSLSADHATVVSELDAAKARIAELESIASGPSAAMQNMATELAQLKAELVQSNAKVAELTALLAAATEPKTAPKSK